MSFLSLLSAIAKKHMTTPEKPPLRTATPLRLSQGSAVEISLVPLILTEHSGALFKSDLAQRHTIVAVGTYFLSGIRFYRAYLSQRDGAYVHFAIKANEIIETRLYQPYDEQIPATAEEWAFWLADDDGYIGYPVMQSRDEDGPQQYRRSWSPSDRRIPPVEPVEAILDSVGVSTALSHQMMHYSRSLTDKLSEHLLVSAVEAPDGMSVNFWLGIDVVPTDLTIFPALDAPQ